jgi:hypothetical protein
MHRKDNGWLIILFCLLFCCIAPETTVYASGEMTDYFQTENNKLIQLNEIQKNNKLAIDLLNDYSDKTSILPVKYDDHDFQPYYNDPHLKFSTKNQPANVYLRKLLSFVYNILRPFIENKATPILLYIAVIGATVLILIWFLHRNIEPVWYHEGSANHIMHAVDKENLIEADFDTLIQNEIKLGNYNNAVRLLFLQTLQKLINQGFIKWEKEKTNYDYLKEIREKIPGSSFNELLCIYECCWYGNQYVDSTKFSNINHRFYEFQHQINA